MKSFSSEMAANSKTFRPSLTRCKTPSRRRDSSPRSYKSKGKRSRNSPPVVRFTSERYRVTWPRNEEQDKDKGLKGRREKSRKTRAEPSTGRLSIYDGYSASKYSDHAPKNRDFLFEKEKMEWKRNDSRQIRGFHHSKTYENRGDRRESTRRLSRISRERSRSGDGIRNENFDDRESHRSTARVPEIHDEAESRYLRPQAVRRPPLAVAVPRPTRILLPPRLVRHPPHMRLPFPTRVIPATVRPVLLAPVVILRAPMMPFRPQIQPVGLCN